MFILRARPPCSSYFVVVFCCRICERSEQDFSKLKKRQITRHSRSTSSYDAWRRARLALQFFMKGHDKWPAAAIEINAQR